MRGHTAIVFLLLGSLAGWYSHKHWGAAPAIIATQPIEQTLPPGPAVQPPPSPQAFDWRDHGQYRVALESYEALQAQGNDTAAARKKDELLEFAQQQIESQNYPLAAEIAQSLLSLDYRDIDALLLQADMLHAEKNLHATIETLFEAKGHATQAQQLQTISQRIREVMQQQTATLRERGDLPELLSLYQYATQLEPDHAPYFIALAETQFAMNDYAGAYNSLALVAHVPGVQSQTEALIHKMQLAQTDAEEESQPIALAQIKGIPLQRSGQHFLVDARSNFAQSVRLMIDTGASITIISPDVLQGRHIRYTDTGEIRRFHTANGPVDAPIYVLKSLSVGSWQVKNLPIAALDLGDQRHIDGLLGMNFLQHFQFYIDQGRHELRLSGK